MEINYLKKIFGDIFSGLAIAKGGGVVEGAFLGGGFYLGGFCGRTKDILCKYTRLNKIDNSLLESEKMWKFLFRCYANAFGWY